MAQRKFRLTELIELGVHYTGKGGLCQAWERVLSFKIQR